MFLPLLSLSCTRKASSRLICSNRRSLRQSKLTERSFIHRLLRACIHPSAELQEKNNTCYFWLKQKPPSRCFYSTLCTRGGVGGVLGGVWGGVQCGESLTAARKCSGGLERSVNSKHWASMTCPHTAFSRNACSCRSLVLVFLFFFFPSF